jgi:hypothetical protein
MALFSNISYLLCSIICPPRVFRALILQVALVTHLQNSGEVDLTVRISCEGSELA